MLLVPASHRLDGKEPVASGDFADGRANDRNPLVSHFRESAKSLLTRGT